MPSRYVYDEALHPTKWTADSAIEFLDEWALDYNTSAMPFFLKLSFHRPHSPYDPPQRWFDRMIAKADQIPEPANATAVDEANGWDSVYISSEKCDPGYTTCGDGCGTQVYCGTVNTSQYRNTRSLYYGSLSFVDEQFGRVMDWLEGTATRWGVGQGYGRALDQTFILYMSDHGDALGDHALWRKAYPTQQVVSVPMYLRWPSSMDEQVALSRGSSLSNVVEIRDVFPTLADLAEVDVTAWGPDTTEEANPDGASMLPLLLAESDEARESVEWREYVGMEMAMCSLNGRPGHHFGMEMAKHPATRPPSPTHHPTAPTTTTTNPPPHHPTTTTPCRNRHRDELERADGWAHQVRLLL